MLRGEERAFERFFEDHAERLYRFALTRLDYDEELAAEVAQSALCNAIDKLDGYRGEATLFSWLCSFCRYEISAHRRRQKRAPAAFPLTDGSAQITALVETANASTSPEDELRRKELVRLVHLTLDHLPARYGSALEWKYLDGLSVEEIAKRLQIGPKAAESVLSRARQSFRNGFAAICKGLDGRGYRGLRLTASRRSG